MTNPARTKNFGLAPENAGLGPVGCLVVVVRVVVGPPVVVVAQPGGIEPLPGPPGPVHTVVVVLDDVGVVEEVNMVVVGLGGRLVEVAIVEEVVDDEVVLHGTPLDGGLVELLVVDTVVTQTVVGVVLAVL